MFIYKLRFFNILRYSYARVSKVTVFLSVFLFLGVVPQALAATYYVATTGNDANPGTPTAPFQTIQKAANVVNPGDTVIVKDGTYGPISVGRGGTSGNFVTFKAENKWGAKVASATIRNGWSLSASYVRIEGFEIADIPLDDSDGFLGWNVTNIQIVGNHIHDIGRLCTATAYGPAGMYFHAGSDILVEQNLIHDIGRYQLGENGCTLGDARHDHAIYIDGTNNFTVKNNIFYNIKVGWSVHVYPAATSGLKILQNTFAFPQSPDTGQIVLASPISNASIANNVFYQPISTALYYCCGYSFSNVQVSNNITYGGVISASSPGGITFSANRDNTDPKFVNAAALDFHLQSTSPAIDTGTTLSEVTTDYDGVPRPQGSAYDIGAYEYGGSPSSFNFSLTNTGDKSITQGSSVQNIITATLVSGTSQSVSFSTSGLPTGATASYSPTSCSPTCSTTLTIATTASTPTGTYPITVTGTGGVTRTTSFNLTVNLAAAASMTIGETNILALDDSGNANLLLAQSATLSQTATIQSMSFHVKTAAGKLRLGIYDASGPSGGPGAKKAETNEITPTTGWNTANVITPVSLPAGTYWLAYLPSDNNLHFSHDTSSGSHRYYSYTYGIMPATFSTSPISNTGHWSFYAMLTTATDTQAPTTPTNLTATAVSSSQINLSWTASTDNVGVSGYRIYRCQGAGCTPSTQIVTSNTTSYSDTGLTAATTYGYRVAAYDGAGNVSSLSSSVSATTGLSASFDFSLGSGLSVIPGSSISTTITTALVSGTSQSVSFSSSGMPSGLTASFSLASCSPTCSTTLTLSANTSASPGTYTIAVTAAGGGITRTTNVTLTVIASGDTTPPSTPAGLTALAISSSQINLSWTASTDNVGVAGYNIYRCQGSSCTPTSLVAIANTPSYQDTGLLTGTTYIYRVAAYDAAGNTSLLSSNASATTGGSTSVQTLTFTPIADATIRPASPTTNYGSASLIEVDNSPVEQYLIKFNITGVGTRSVTSAKLRLYNTNPSDKGGDFYRTADTSWSETAVTWNTAPVTSGTPIASLGSVASGNTYDIDLTSFITGDGVYSLRVLSTSSDGADYYSKEGSTKPALTLTVSGAIAKNSTGSFSRNLAVGSSGADVEKLQQILGEMQDIYPTGLITGYFGSLTKQAVGRLQLRHGIIPDLSASVMGMVGPKTRALLETLFSQP